jgi:hypothetical protein
MKPMFLDLALHLLVALDVLADDSQGPLGLLVAPDEGVFVLRMFRFMGGGT